ncbi:DUF533 domain-containing protein [Jannaschia pohangensis]|uniref:Uncharacterized membrane protein YebE, DUF533 family n=1 Tax=Jannaschia pohangensis TaxID=390807 RepID=A0A1I3HX41_9RHOB|nr:DUF533 domain-containing protein [Jannaschia pohangensis]SFI40285.1 Uncharacterized membrane protein YebE, DUF533 family [Jannaschia pohangensis]
MSLKKMAVGMVVAFAATKGYDAFRRKGGMAGVQKMLASSGGSGGLMGALQGRGGSSGGLGGLLGQLGGGTPGKGLLGGLAAMAGGSAALGSGATDDSMMTHAEAGPQDEATAAAMVRAIGQAVRADGQIDADERAALDQILGDADSPEDRAVIDQALSEPIHPEGLARDVPRGSEAAVYAAALTAINPDHPAERDFLNRFATALALDPQEVAMLHRQVH